MNLTISQLVAHAESNDKLHAIRFEPKYTPGMANVLACIKANGPMSGDTARNICACSIGKYQIMGDNIYWLGYTGTILDFWKSPEIQLEYFNKFLKRREIDFTIEDVINNKVKRDLFSKRYNGSVLYGDRLLTIYNSLKGK